MTENGLRGLDVEGIFRWPESALADLRSRHNLSGLMVPAHGRSCALLGEDKTLAAPIVDYEQEIPAAANAEFARIAPAFAETYSPDLPGGLNMGRAIFFQEWADPTLASRVRHILTYPQYWTWCLSGALASEISFLGCHSHMWNPRAGRFSSLAVKRGWAKKFPPFAPAGALVGERDGLGVHNGVHDSNAAFYYYTSLGFSHFTLMSTGAWVIIFNPVCPLDRLDSARDMLAIATLAALRPGQSLYRNTNAESAAMGAAALAFRALGKTSVFPRDIDKVEAWELPDLAGSYARWLKRV